MILCWVLGLEECIVSIKVTMARVKYGSYVPGSVLIPF